MKWCVPCMRPVWEVFMVSIATAASYRLEGSSYSDEFSKVATKVGGWVL